MTESLLQQARRWREMAGTCIVPIGEPDLEKFLDAVISVLEREANHERLREQYGDLDQRQPDHQRTHTLAIVAAIIKTSDGTSSQLACIEAEALLAAVEERQR